MEAVRTIFSQFLNMSLTAGIVILLVIFVRLCLKRVPKIFSYCLWLVVLLRLLCPVSFSSALSVFRFVDAPVNGQGTITYIEQEPVQIKVQETSPVMPDMAGQTEVPVQKIWDFWAVGGIVWLTGAAVLWVYSIISVFRLKRRLAAAVCDRDNIFLCDYIQTAFVMGMFRPRIYLPTALAETERQYILLHEQTHIRRHDHIFRLLAFLALSLHWFNPLVWCAFYLSGRDMEMSCDEAVMRKMGTDLRAAYSETLLNLSAGKKIFAGAPLGFGEGNVKYRIKNVMRYKKTAVFIAVPVLAVVVLVLIVLGSNPAKTERKGQQSGGNVPADTQQETQSTVSVQPGDDIPVSVPAVSPEAVCDQDGPILDYVNEEDGGRFVFHCSSGLFVYDAKQNALIGAVDLGELDCFNAEGNLNLDCEVMVSGDGTAVYIHPAGNEEMYVYDIDNKRLTRHTYNMEETEMFTHLKDTNDCVNPGYTLWRSKECVPLRKYDFFYLESGSGLLKDLSFVIEKDHNIVQKERIFPEEGQQSGENRSYDISLEEASIWPVVELPVFDEAVKQGQLVEYDKDFGGTLPGSDAGVWYSVTADGVEYLYAKYDGEENIQLFSWALRDSSHKLGNGIHVGMTEEEVLRVCPALAEADFSGEGWPAWNRCAYPEHWSDEFDSMLVADVEDNKDNIPVFLAVMMKDGVVRALTFYMPTAA